jgi:hypothetical protein
VASDRGALAVTLAVVAKPAATQPVPLFPAQVSGGNIDALFGQQTPVPAETTNISLPGINGNAVLHLRVIRAAPGSRAEGRFAYEYRTDLGNATTFVERPSAPRPTPDRRYDLRLRARIA